MEPARLSITQTADSSMKNVICDGDGQKKDNITLKCCSLLILLQLLHLSDFAFEISCSTRGTMYSANESSLKLILTDHQRGN